MKIKQSNFAITFKKNAILSLAGTMLFASCASKTLIQSNPSGAKVYLNGESVGVTPYSHKDTKIIGSTTNIKLEKEGYEIFNTSFSRNEKADVGAIIGGVFVLVPFLWTMKYKPERTYDLIPAGANTPQVVTSDKANSKSTTDRLKELKELFDQKLISQEEYDTQRKKILDANK
ncbi:PEGA domain-containing protein [Sphingobacterium spiritivorum]|uniref:PEGA domain-containing protein n=2 Tax=Sphingobacterium spiritivorum TaxID=258 RepID=UPI003DA5092D